MHREPEQNPPNREATLIRYSVRLSGANLQGRRIRGALLRDLLDFLTESARGALRLRAEGRSSAPGVTPSWLQAAADFDFIGIEPGSTILMLEARPLAEASDGALDQGEFFEPLDTADGPITLVQESLSDAVRGDADSTRFDDALLDRFELLGRVFSRGVDQVEIANGRSGGLTVVTTPATLDTLRSLRHTTPPEQSVRVAGWLDQIRHSDRMFTLKLEDGTVLRGIAEGVSTQRLAGLWGRKAIVHGRATFRPSGRVLRLEALDIAPAGEDFSFWSQEPLPLAEGVAPQVRHPQAPHTGINAVIGGWPGDESDDDIARALEALS